MTNSATAAARQPDPTNQIPTSLVPLNTLFLAVEAPKGVNLVVRNSSSGSPLTDAELKASIYAKGVIYPLIFKLVDGKKYIVAGNRRLSILREIYGNQMSLVSVQDVEDFGGDWREVAMDTNIALPPHLVERYEIIVALTRDLKLSPDDARLRFGMTPRQYNQVMALGKMSPMIREEWKAGNIDAKCAQAFTLEPDPKEQDRIFAAVKKANGTWRAGRVDASDVKHKIIPNNRQEAGKLVAFVGVDVCKKAKIIKQEDLFTNDHVVSDLKALKKLAGDKISEKLKELTDAGWKWASTDDNLEGSSYNYGSINPAKKSEPTPEEAKQLDNFRAIEADDEGDDFEEVQDQRLALEEEIQQRGYTPDQRKKSGCILKIMNDGNLSIEYGRVKPSERQAAAASERAAKPAAPKKPSKPGEVALTNALTERLSKQLEKSISEAIAVTPHVAVAALIAGFASSGTVVDVNIGNGAANYSKNGDADFAQVFDGAVKATAESQAVMLTKVVAEAISIAVFNHASKPPLDSKALQVMIARMSGQALSKSLVDTFDAKGYFAGINMEAIIDAVRCANGAGAAAEVAKMKKGKAAEYAAKHVPASGWLPPMLRTVHYKGPVEITRPKVISAKKAAPAKKPAKKSKAKKAKK